MHVAKIHLDQSHLALEGSPPFCGLTCPRRWCRTHQLGHCTAKACMDVTYIHGIWVWSSISCMGIVFVLVIHQLMAFQIETSGRIRLSGNLRQYEIMLLMVVGEYRPLLRIVSSVIHFPSVSDSLEPRRSRIRRHFCKKSPCAQIEAGPTWGWSGPTPKEPKIYI